jgi:hypothetical protein
MHQRELTGRLHESAGWAGWGASVASSPVGRSHRRQPLFGFIKEGVNGG